MVNSKIKTGAVLIAISFLAYCAGTVTETRISEEERTQLQKAMEAVSKDTLLKYVAKLSSEDFAGRLAGTPEYKACANWVASLFEQWGIAPEGEKDTFLQSYPNPYTIVFVGGELSHTYKSRGKWRKKKYVYEKEYYPGSQSGNGKRTAEVVYVGYGITASELEYDDYADVNVKGKIVLVEPEVPVSSEKNPDLYKEWRPYALPQYKIKMAVAHGARGMLINDLRVNPNIDYVEGFMVSQVGDAVVTDIFAGRDKTHEQVKAEIQTDLKPRSFRTGKTFTIENFTEHHKRGVGYNVLGLIAGTDPLLKEEAIIMGANLDHCGFCYEVIPGANDNASGIAVMLGMAEALSKSPVKTKRSILFIAFGSKEQALRGAETYLADPVFPKDKTVAFLNLDRVGCGDKLQALAALDYPDQWSFIAKANDALSKIPMDTLPYPGVQKPMFDADLFLNKKIPIIILRAYGTPTFPHTTKDTLQTITPKMLEDLAFVLYKAVLDMANSSKDFFAPK
ncbi:MAG: M28 family peptidase [Candidatus Aminicenantes bacterium]|nr:M28 family peptidase [Candidatus Aminicenantes bacterium]